MVPDILPKSPRPSPAATDGAEASISPVTAPEAVPATAIAPEAYPGEHADRARMEVERLRRDVQRRELAQVSAMSLEARQSVFCRLLAGEGWDSTDAPDLPTIRRCCQRMGISPATVYRWEDSSPVVASALELHRTHARRWARDWMPSVIQGEVRASHEQTGLAIWTAGGGKTGTGAPAVIRVVYEDSKGKVGVEIELPGSVDGNNQQ